jgi:hypothetical protein
VPFLALLLTFIYVFLTFQAAVIVNSSPWCAVGSSRQGPQMDHRREKEEAPQE